MVCPPREGGFYFGAPPFLSQCSSPPTSPHATEMAYKVGPRLCESRLLAPSGRGVEFTQPRAHLIGQISTELQNKAPRGLRLLRDRACVPASAIAACCFNLMHNSWNPGQTLLGSSVFCRSSVEPLHYSGVAGRGSRTSRRKRGREERTRYTTHSPFPPTFLPALSNMVCNDLARF